MILLTGIYAIVTRTSPFLTLLPTSISTEVTVPATGDLISVSIFIASTTAITSPSATVSLIDTNTFNTTPGKAAFTGLPSPAGVETASIPALTPISYSLPLTVALLPSRATAYFYR